MVTSPTAAQLADHATIESASARFPTLAEAWRRHRYVLPALVLSLAVCTWFVTWGDWSVFEEESFCRFYDAQAHSILAGHLDVPADAVGFEAYVFRGKTYGYFGIGPALLRLPLVLIFGDLLGPTSRAMILIACIANLVCGYGILRTIRARAPMPGRQEQVIHSLYIVAAGIGSTNVFLMSRSFVFHEALMWGSAFALACAWTLIRYLRTGCWQLLALAGLFSFMSFHCRPTAGAGALAAIGFVGALLALRAMFSPTLGQRVIGLSAVSKPMSGAVIAAVAVSITLASYFAVNYAKFRTIDGIPVQYYRLYIENPERMKVTGAKQIHPENIPTSIANYFGFPGMRLRQDFPWVFLNDKATVVGAPALDVVEGFSSIPVSMPALSLLACVGLVSLWRGSNQTVREARLPVCALFLGGSIVLMTVGITERYLHDFYPALILCAAIGTAAFPFDRLRVVKLTVMAGLVVVSVWMNCGFAIVFQRAAPWGVPPDKRAEFVQWQRSVGQFFGYQQPE